MMVKPRDRLVTLRRVDGLSHVAIGPPLLAAASPLAQLTGVSVRTVVTVLLPFTAYGYAVVVATRESSVPPPQWLVPLAVTANLSAVGLVVAAAVSKQPTVIGRLCGVGLAAGGVRMLAILRRRWTIRGDSPTADPSLHVRAARHRLRSLEGMGPVPRRALLAYAVAAVVFLVVDLVWLTAVADDLYADQLGPLMAESPRPLAAVLFYALFVSGLVYFVVLPALARHSVRWAVGSGAFFGLVTYATWDLTSLAVIEDFPAALVPIDLTWGAVLSATVCGTTTFVLRRLGHVTANAVTGR